MGNILQGLEGTFLLDFDDCLVGPAVQDFWMILPRNEQESAGRLELLIEAYEQFRPFDRASIRLIEPLRAMRFIHYAAWIARRWEDPAFPQAFPHFGTEAYWEGETRDLEEQLGRIQKQEPSSASSRVAPIEAEKELTNKDFFWDM